MITLVFSANATTEYIPEERGIQPTASELASSRSCWQELQTLGCGDPAEDMEQFRSCMNNVYTSLSASCKKLMSELYK